MTSDSNANTDARRTTHNTLIPPATTAMDAPTDPDRQVIREDIVDPLSQGTHHDSPALPTDGTVLPAREDFIEALETVQTYLFNAGCGILADSHLRGLSATVTVADSGEVYAYLDDELFQETIMEALQDATDTQSRDAEDCAELASAVKLAHDMEFRQTMQERDIDADSEAEWREFAGKETTSPTGVVFTTPHPVESLDEYTMLPERAIAMIGGIQHLTADIDGVYGQRDIAAVYLQAYLQAHGLTDIQAASTISNWYDMPRECLTSLTTRFAEDTVHGLPADDPEFRYYLTQKAAAEIHS